MAAYDLFETALGPCAIAWSERGIVRIQLPEATERRTRERLLRESAEPLAMATPPAWVRAVARSIERHLAGDVQDFASVRLDLEAVRGFRRRVYEAAREIAPSRTVTYGELAALAGSPKAFRAVGQAMAKNPWPIVVPCHRVLAAGGKPGGFSAFGELATKARILALEGVKLERAQTSIFRGSTAPPLDARRSLRHLRKADPELARVIEKVGAFRLRLQEIDSVFEALGQAIIYQQLAGKAAAAILGRVRGLFSDRFPAPRELLETSDERLRSAGLSRPKLAALRDLAAKVEDGTVPPLADLHALEDDAIVERLTAVRGIGRWTVEMLLVFRLGRPDVLPATDYGVRKGFERAFATAELPSPREILERGERWRPWRTVASWYLWRVLET